MPPPHPFTDDEREQADAAGRPRLQGLRRRRQTLQFILGQRTSSEWDAYVSELEGKNMGTYMDLVNGAYERYVTQNG